MDLGKSIKYYRMQKGLSQKELADKLFVTYQAVSRWENNQAEPSIDTLNSMAQIFDCSINDIVNYNEPISELVPETSETSDTKETKVEVKEEAVNDNVNTKPVVEKQIIALCDCCDKPIYELSQLKRFKPIIKTDINGVPQQSDRKFTYCIKCYNKYIQDQQERKKQAVSQKQSDLKHSRNLSLGLSILFGGISLIIGVLLFTLTNYHNIGIFFMVSSVPTFTFVGTMVLDNTFLNEFWYGALELGFVKMPGIIFTFDIGGFIFLIAMKILFAILGFLIGLAVFLAATAIAYFLSLFAYPLAIYRNHNEMPELNSTQNMQSIKQYVESKEKTKTNKE